MEGIGDFLKDEQPVAAVEPAAGPEAQAATEATPEPTAEQPQGQPRGPDGKFAKKETGVEEPAVEPQAPVPPTEQPHQQLPRDVYEPLKAVREENRELKQRLAALERQTFQQPQPPQPPVDFWDDPQSFMDARMNQLGQTLLQQWEQRETAKRLDQSEQAARR